MWQCIVVILPVPRLESQAQENPLLITSFQNDFTKINGLSVFPEVNKFVQLQIALQPAWRCGFLVESESTSNRGDMVHVLGIGEVGG